MKSAGSASIQSAEIVAGDSSTGDQSSRYLVVTVLITGRYPGILSVIKKRINLFYQTSTSDVSTLGMYHWVSKRNI